MFKVLHNSASPHIYCLVKPLLLPAFPKLSTLVWESDKITYVPPFLHPCTMHGITSLSSSARLLPLLIFNLLLKMHFCHSAYSESDWLVYKLYIKWVLLLSFPWPLSTCLYLIVSSLEWGPFFLIVWKMSSNSYNKLIIIIKFISIM